MSSAAPCHALAIIWAVFLHWERTLERTLANSETHAHGLIIEHACANQQALQHLCQRALRASSMTCVGGIGIHLCLYLLRF